MKRRREFYVEEEVAERLATMAAKPGSSKTAIMTNALKAYFDFTALGPNSKRFRAWLGRLSVQLGRIERDRQIVAETSDLLALFQLLVTTSLSDPDRAALPTAQERFKAFIEQVSRRVSRGRGLTEDVLSLTSDLRDKAMSEDRRHRQSEIFSSKVAEASTDKVPRPPQRESKRTSPPLTARIAKPFRQTIRRSELRQIVPVADTTIYEMEQRGQFPRRFYLTPRCVVWDLAEVEAWIEERRLASEAAVIKRAPIPDVRRRKTRPVRQ